MTIVGLVLGLTTSTAAIADVTFGTKSAPDIEIGPSLGDRLEGIVGRSGPEVKPDAQQSLRDAITRRGQGDTKDLPKISYDYGFVDTLPAADGNAQFQCLAEALYFEARGETAEGVFAVAEVILNRVDSKKFPDTICKVVNQGTGRKYACQFSYTCDGLPEAVGEPRIMERMEKIAGLMIDGAPRDLTDGALFYHTKAVSPYWASAFDRVTTIGEHHFYVQS
ncbi:cell wall hydrolase [Palleronia sp.]|uniref:cell wall hydrolase n=1 Tax=Palleronia sp. TaxID=1940284 RepID=UPI0035C7D241